MHLYKVLNSFLKCRKLVDLFDILKANSFDTFCGIDLFQI